MSDSTVAVATPAKTKVAKVKKVQPVYDEFTVKRTKEGTFEMFDSKGALVVGTDQKPNPRQIMMFLAHKAGEVLYFRGKKWRRKSTAANVTKTAIPVSTTATAVTA